MTRERIGGAFMGLVASAVLVWVARNTYWPTVKVPLPLKGEAATNPFYNREKFAPALGARTRWSRDFTLPPTSGLAYVSTLVWELLPERRKRFEQGVESGGRLGIDCTLIRSSPALV